MMTRALELYCGIGGFAKACEDFSIDIVKAYDQSDAALNTYNTNFSHPATKFNLEKFNARHLESLSIDLLWMSPPCQPYTSKGVQKDFNDTRANSFKTILNAIAMCDKPPTHIAVENVEGFKKSKMREILISTLQTKGYYINETLLCPSELGVPNRRLRYYLCASKKPLKKLEKKHIKKKLLEFITDPDKPYLIPPKVLEKFAEGFRILESEDEKAYTTCFTSSYSKSWMHSGAYLKTKDGIRLFEPNEIAHILGFGKDFIFPQSVTKRQAYKLIGNSLSVDVVSCILTQFDL